MDNRTLEYTTLLAALDKRLDTKSEEEGTHVCLGAYECGMVHRFQASYIGYLFH